MFRPATMSIGDQMRLAVVLVVAVVIALSLIGCRIPTAERTVVAPRLAADTIYLRAACRFPTVWQFWIDGHPRQPQAAAWPVIDSAVFRFGASPGRHEMDYARWVPTISANSPDSVWTAVLYRLPCAAPDTLGTG